MNFPATPLQVWARCLVGPPEARITANLTSPSAPGPHMPPPPSECIPTIHAADPDPCTHPPLSLPSIKYASRRLRSRRSSARVNPRRRHLPGQTQVSALGRWSSPALLPTVKGRFDYGTLTCGCGMFNQNKFQRPSFCMATVKEGTWRVRGSFDIYLLNRSRD